MNSTSDCRLTFNGVTTVHHLDRLARGLRSIARQCREKAPGLDDIEEVLRTREHVAIDFPQIEGGMPSWSFRKAARAAGVNYFWQYGASETFRAGLEVYDHEDNTSINIHFTKGILPPPKWNTGAEFQARDWAAGKITPRFILCQSRHQILSLMADSSLSAQHRAGLARAAEGF